MEKKEQTVKLGRPRCFCEENALDAAMRVFWEKGYEGASLTELTGAMGINRPSLYAAFGNKEELFTRVLERYAEGPGAYVGKALKKPTIREALEALLRGSLMAYAHPTNPHGCLAVHGAIATGDEGRGAHETVVKWRLRGEQLVERRMVQAQKEGDLPESSDPAALTHFVMAVLYGLAVQAAYGAPKAELEKVIGTALQSLAPMAWPEKRRKKAATRE